MTRDSIVDEVRAVREAYAQQFDFDIRAICHDLKQQEKESGRKIVSPPPKRMPTAEKLAVARP